MPADYFMTMSTAEVQSAIETYGYGNNQTVCWMFQSEQPGTIPLYRLLYLKSSPGIHFYTVSEAEAQSLVGSGAWTSEGTTGYLYSAQSDGTVPLFRLANDVTHIYTASAAERDGLLMCPGWTYEGVIGYVGSPDSTPQSGTSELYRLWVSDPVPVGANGTLLVINNSNNPLLVSGSRGSDLKSVALNQVIPSFGGSLQVANVSPDSVDIWDWVYLLDLIAAQRYQLYVEYDSASGKAYHDFGYFDPQSSEKDGNPNPFQNGFSTSTWSDGIYVVYTLDATPPVQATDLQAVTDLLGFLLVGQTFEWSASTTYDTKQYPELAKYLPFEVQISVAGDAV